MPAMTPAERQRRIRLQQRRKRAARARLILFLTSCVLFILIFVGVAFASYRFVKPSQQTYSIRCLLGKRVVATVAAGNAYRNGELYLSYTDLSSFCDVGLVGDGQDLTIVFSGGERIYCTLDPASLSLNGQPTPLTHGILYAGGEYYFPVELIESYFDGVTVVYDDKTSRCMLTCLPGQKLSLRQANPDPTDAISEPGQSDADVSGGEGSGEPASEG